MSFSVTAYRAREAPAEEEKYLFGFYEPTIVSFLVSLDGTLSFTSNATLEALCAPTMCQEIEVSGVSQ